LRSTSKLPSLKIGQSWKISTSAEPRCSAAACRTAVRLLRSESSARPMKVASAPSASEIGLNGWSTEPRGVDLVTFPSSEVGEYWPLVSP
jgi:hypothetical protein